MRTEELRDVILRIKHLIVGAPSANALISAFFQFSTEESKRDLLRTTEMIDLIIDVLAPTISGGDPVETLGKTICNTVYEDKHAAQLFSNRKSFSAILDCFHRATTASAALYLAGSINNICYSNPGANKNLNDLPVVEAYSAIIPHATTDESVKWISSSLLSVLGNNEPAHKLFGTPTFLENFKSLEKYATSDEAKTLFDFVVEVLQPILTRYPIEKRLRDASTSRALVAALDETMNQYDCWRSLVELLLQKQHLIQDQESTYATAKFISWVASKNPNFLKHKEVYELFQNILLPNSLKFVAVIPAVHEALLSTITNNKEGQEFFSTTSFENYVVAALPHSN